MSKRKSENGSVQPPPCVRSRMIAPLTTSSPVANSLPTPPSPDPSPFWPPLPARPRPKVRKAEPFPLPPPPPRTSASSTTPIAQSPTLPLRRSARASSSKIVDYTPPPFDDFSEEDTYSDGDGTRDEDVTSDEDAVTDGEEDILLDELDIDEDSPETVAETKKNNIDIDDMTPPDFNDLLTVPSLPPPSTHETTLRARFKIMYRRLMDTPAHHPFWTHLITPQREEDWWKIFRAGINEGLIHLLCGDTPPTAQDLATIDWFDDGMGVYFKLGIGKDGHICLVYVGSATAVPRYDGDVHGLGVRKRQHEASLSASIPAANMFDNIHRAAPDDRVIAFVTAFRLPSASAFVDKTTVTDSRLKSRFMEYLFCDWTQSWADQTKQGSPPRDGVPFWSIERFDYLGTNSSNPLNEGFLLPTNNFFKISKEELRIRRNTYAREYYKRNGEQVRAYNNGWYAENRDRMKDQRANVSAEQKQRNQASTLKSAIKYYAKKRLNSDWRQDQNAKVRKRYSENGAYDKEKKRLMYAGLWTPEKEAEIKLKHGIGPARTKRKSKDPNMELARKRNKQYQLDNAEYIKKRKNLKYAGLWTKETEAEVKAEFGIGPSRRR